MYLTHITCLEHLKPILKSGQLKSSKITGNIGLGADVYKNSIYVFFSVTNELINKRQNGDNTIILYFHPNILKNKTFYVSNEWDETPGLQEFGTKKFKCSTSKNIIQKIKGASQVAVANKIAIKKHLVGIEINSSKNPSPYLIKYIQKEYPNTIIVRNPPPTTTTWNQTFECEL